MNSAPLLAAGLLAAALVQRPDPTPTPAALRSEAPAASATAAPARPGPGDVAPDFTYQSADYLWQSLHNMLEQGDVLLVFGAADEQLRALEHERDDLLGTGVVPVAVLAAREGDVWRTLRRCDLTYSLLADPHGVIAGQFGVLDPGSQRPAGAWFVIDRTRRVRAAGALASGARGWTALAAGALGRTGVHAASSH